MKSIKLFVLVLGTALYSCAPQDPNIDKSGTDELESLEIEVDVDGDAMTFHDLIYVPIYSDIYASIQDQDLLLAATLSIRNTSSKDSLFISQIDYFNTHGDLVRSFIDNNISIPPMATVNYVIEQEDDTGGPGANFLVALNARNKNMKPLLQAVMVSHTGNKSFAFSTDGYSIKGQD